MSDDDPDKCPMMLLEVEVARHCGTTYEHVVQGLVQAGCMKCVTIADTYAATDQQVTRLCRELMGDLIHTEIEHRDESFYELKRRAERLELALAGDPDAQRRLQANALLDRALVTLDTLEAIGEQPRNVIGEEVRSEMIARLKYDIGRYLGRDAAADAASVPE